LGNYFAIVVGVFEFFWIVSTHSTVILHVLRRMLSQNQNKQTKKMVEKKPLLRKEYERLSKVGSFISRLQKNSVG
jgi:hypothetical protein